MKNQKMMKKPMNGADDYSASSKNSKSAGSKKMPAPNKLMAAGSPKSKRRDC